MGHIEVDPGELSGVAGALKAFQDDSGRAHQALGGVNEGAAGHPVLSSAVAGFSDKWKYSLKKIAEHAQAMGDKTQAAADGYGQTEQGIADAAAGNE